MADDILERHDDFAIPGHALDQSSLVLRYDAISADYLHARCIGPNDRGDTTLGLLTRMWEVRVVNGDPNRIFLRGSTLRIGEAGTPEWGEEVEVFSFGGAPVYELDLAWDQNARIAMCAERPSGAGGLSQVWLYWFNPQVGDFVFQTVTPGRTPRIVLDDPAFPQESDLLLFYVDNFGVRVRVQREVFATPYDLPVGGWGDLKTHAEVSIDPPNFHLEDAGLTRDRRMTVVGSQRNAETGRYQLLTLGTAPYPFRMTDAVATTQRMTLANTQDVVIGKTLLGEGATVGQRFTGVSTVIVIMEKLLPADDAVTTTGRFLTLDTFTVIIEKNLTGAPEAATTTQRFLTFATSAVILERILPGEAVQAHFQRLMTVTTDVIIPTGNERILPGESVLTGQRLLGVVTEIQ